MKLQRIQVGRTQFGALRRREEAPVNLPELCSTLIDDPLAPSLFARSVRSALPNASLRMIPTHREMVRDIARAVALDLVLREPLAVATP